MSWTDEDLAKLQAAMASGARKVKYQDQEVEYRSITEMERVEAKVKGALGQLPCSRQTFVTSKGLD